MTSIENLSPLENNSSSDEPVFRNQIAILPVDLLDENRLTVEALRQLAYSLGLEFGWHYLLDLTWILSHLGQVKGKFIMDAGAGTGMMQWYLATQGAEVLSVDRGSRAMLPARFRSRFNVVGLRQEPEPDLLPAQNFFTKNLENPKNALVQVRDLIAGSRWSGVRRTSGRVILYNQDLKALVDVLDDSLDAIVAVSALEHNEPEDLQDVVKELMRVLKPGGYLLATLGAAKDEDWYHLPSAGWCYTEATLRQIFSLPEDTPSNYIDYDVLFEKLNNCAELRDNLASFYSRSGNNGMPWGLWNPQYQPVGICKVKEN